MSGISAPNGSINVTIVATESTTNAGEYSSDGSIRVTIVGSE